MKLHGIPRGLSDACGMWAHGSTSEHVTNCHQETMSECVPAKLSTPALNNILQLKEASVKGNPKAEPALQGEDAPDPATLTRVSGATHSSQASHQALVKDEAVKDEREPPPADLAVQIDPKTVSAAVAQVCSWGLPDRLMPVSSWGAACPKRQQGLRCLLASHSASSWPGRPKWQYQLDLRLYVLPWLRCSLFGALAVGCCVSPAGCCMLQPASAG